MDRNPEALEDLLGTLRWSLEIEWTDEQRSEFSPLCHRLSMECQGRYCSNNARNVVKRKSAPLSLIVR